MNNRITPLEIRDILLAGFSGVLLTILTQIIFFLSFLLPLPYIYVINKHGHRSGTIAIGVTALINLFSLGFMGLVYTLVSFGLVAVIVGGAFREKLKPSRVLILSIISSMVSGLIIYYLYLKLGYLAQLQEFIIQSLQDISFFEDLIQKEVTKEDLELYVRSLFVSLPGIMTSLSMVFGILTYYISANFLNRIGLEVQKIRPFKLWIFPRWIAFLFVLFLILPKDPISTNISAVLGTLLVIEGISVLVYYGDKWGLYPLVRNILVFAVVVLLSIFIYMLGLIDNLFNLRRLKKENEV